MPRNTPSASVIIPTCDRPDFLENAVVSVLRALPARGEIVIVDDGKIPAAQTLEGIDGPIRVFPSKGSGVSAARNTGLEAARGDVIFFLDDDDEMLPHYCKEVLELLQHTPADFGHSACLRVRHSADGRKAVPPILRQLPSGLIPKDTPFADQTFGFGTGLWITRAAYERLGPLDETLSMNEDTEYHCRTLVAGLQGWYSSTPGVRLGLHETGARPGMEQSADRHTAKTRAACFVRIRDLYRNALADVPGASDFILSRLVKHLTKSRQDRQAWSISLAESGRLRWKLLGVYLAQRMRAGR